MYSILHIPTNTYLVWTNPSRTPIIDIDYAFVGKKTQDFYSLKDSINIIRNFIDYDKYNRGYSIYPPSEFIWLKRHNILSYSTYRTNISAFCRAYNVAGWHDMSVLGTFHKEEFMIIKTKRIRRIWEQILDVYVHEGI